MAESVKYLLIGGGIASVSAAVEIRKRDSEGRCMLVSADRYMPYDHPPLSKNFLTDLSVTEEDAASKYDSFYTNNKVEVRLNSKVKNVDRKKHVATLEDGSEIEYQKLLIATGASPNRLDIFPEDHPNVFVLRSVDDAKAIRNRMQEAKTALVVGSGFMGMEVAADMASKDIAITLISPDEYPWHRFASPRLGQFMTDYYTSHGVKVILNDQVVAHSDPLTVITGKKQQVVADMVVLAVGVTLELELAKQAGLQFLADAGVDVDEMLQTSDPDIYVAGDIAHFKDLTMNRKWHLEHHLNAKWQGEVAGANMAGDRVIFDRVPYFFSDFLDLHMIYRGDSEPGRLTTVLGSFDAAEFIELYHDEAGFLHMGIAISREEKKLDPISDKLEGLIRAKSRIEDISEATFG